MIDKIKTISQFFRYPETRLLHLRHLKRQDSFANHDHEILYLRVIFFVLRDITHCRRGYKSHRQFLLLARVEKLKVDIHLHPVAPAFETQDLFFHLNRGFL